jgi:hypothetical protein
MGLVERPDGLRLSQQVEPSVADLFGDFGALAADAMIATASRIELSAEFSGGATLTDRGTSRFTIQADGDRWHLQRSDTALPFLAAEAVLARRDGEGLSLWIDSETIEALTPDGTGAASFQHRPTGTQMALETDQPQRVSVASLA